MFAPLNTCGRGEEEQMSKRKENLMEILLFRNACPQWTMTDSPCRHMLCPRAPKETKSIEEDEKEEKEEEQWVDIKLDVRGTNFLNPG